MSKARKPPIEMQRVGGTYLQPRTPFDAARLAEYPRGKALSVRISQKRSLPQHRLYWALLQLVCENLDTPVTEEALHEWVKLKCGVTAAIPLKSGKVDIVPGSISFENMEQPEFQKFLDRAKALLVEHIIPGVGGETLEREARAILGEAA